MNNFIFENKTKVYFGKGGVKAVSYTHLDVYKRQGQYFALPERARMPVPQTSQRRSFFGLRMACSSFGCWGSTAR